MLLLSCGVWNELRDGQRQLQHKLLALQPPQLPPTPSGSGLPPLQLDLSDAEVDECLSLFSGEELSFIPTSSFSPSQPSCSYKPPNSTSFSSSQLYQPSQLSCSYQLPSTFSTPKTPPRVNIGQVTFPGTPQERKIECLLKPKVFQNVSNAGRLGISLAKAGFFLEMRSCALVHLVVTTGHMVYWMKTSSTKSVTSYCECTSRKMGGSLGQVLRGNRKKVPGHAQQELSTTYFALVAMLFQLVLVLCCVVVPADHSLHRERRVSHGQYDSSLSSIAC